MLFFDRLKMVGVLCVVMGFAGQAYADTLKSNCTVTKVQLDSTNGGGSAPNRMVITCANDSNMYYAFTFADGSSCPSSTVQSVDTLKIWTAMAQAALLSGHLVDFWFSTACTDKAMTSGFTIH